MATDAQTAVDRVGRSKQRDINARFLAMTSHYVFEPEFCNPAAGWEKGQVEKNVRDARHHAKGGLSARCLWQVASSFPDLEALNDWLEDRCKVLWAETAHGRLPPLTHACMRCWATGSIADIWEVEKLALIPLPTTFDGFVELSKRVSPTCLITFDHEEDQETIRGIVSPTQGYSVPASFANCAVSLHIYPERLVIVLKARLWRDVAEGAVICTHVRITKRSHRQPGRVIYDWRHYLAVLQRKPGALRPSRQICFSNRLPGNERCAVRGNA